MAPALGWTGDAAGAAVLGQAPPPPTREQPYQYNIGPVPWRMLLLIWLLGVGTVVLSGCFRLLRAYRMSADESRMVLQESLWAETRGEQRRHARWLAWARRKANRTLEKEA